MKKILTSFLLSIVISYNIFTFVFGQQNKKQNNYWILGNKTYECRQRVMGDNYLSTYLWDHPIGIIPFVFKQKDNSINAALQPNIPTNELILIKGRFVTEELPVLHYEFEYNEHTARHPGKPNKFVTKTEPVTYFLAERDYKQCGSAKAIYNKSLKQLTIEIDCDCLPFDQEETEFIADFWGANRLITKTNLKKNKPIMIVFDNGMLSDVALDPPLNVTITNLPVPYLRNRDNLPSLIVSISRDAFKDSYFIVE